ncbi:MAG: enoyl-CoA hydratase/isomerase family protein [Acidimicrobiales bacterium]|nr:enoyl-CoA hydratase/isomerase family protein [Acidimicrobiales bacterium]
MGEHVQLERDTAPGVATIRLDRPKVNAITVAMTEDLHAICTELAADEGVRSVVFTGGERHFAAGMDIGDFERLDRAGAHDLATKLNAAALALENLPQITISAINGFALGGGLELAMATDFRIAAGDARMGQPEMLLGVMPGGGGSQRLPRLTGITLAKELIYTGRNLTAEEALAAGVISSIHEPDEVQAAAVELATRYAAGPASLRLAKTVMVAGMHLSVEDAVQLEIEAFADAFETDDRTIGVASFLENGPGKAEFTGR